MLSHDKVGRSYLYPLLRGFANQVGATLRWPRLFQLWGLIVFSLEVGLSGSL